MIPTKRLILKIINNAAKTFKYYYKFIEYDMKKIML